VAGDIESVREWIVDQENGLLCDPTSPHALARAMLQALNDQELRDRAKKINLRLVRERAEYDSVMQQAEDFYGQVVRGAHSS
jgi:glycosyltransferase involved in cell wall biosynthesis